MKNETIYHACRLAFNAGSDDVPWHLMLHALREGLDLKQYMTHKLTEEQLQQYPVLRELIAKLQERG